MSARRPVAARPSLRLSVCLALAASVAAGCGSDGDEDRPYRPFREAWADALIRPFVHTTDGTAQIHELTIGGRTFNKNFANRGDVIVLFDGAPDEIHVEMRRFTFATGEDEAQDDFDDLGLWAYNADISQPKLPGQMDPDTSCGEAFRDGCGIRIYYDGMDQPLRSGADLRVHLPPDYTGKVEIFTEDSIEQDGYSNRGNICVQDVLGSVSAELASGVAFVTVADEAQVMPRCPADDIAACNAWTDLNGDPDPWGAECPCVFAEHTFGQVDVRAEGSPATMIADVPAELWTSLNAETRTDPLLETGCAAQISVPNVELAPEFADQVAKALGEANAPSGAVAGGYTTSLISGACAPVTYTEHPQDYDPGADQAIEARGDVEVCSNCIRDLTCADLLP